MKALLLTLALAAAATLSSAQTNQPSAAIPPSKPDSAKQLERLERKWADAIKRHDSATINKIQADDFQFIDPSGQIWAKARALESISSGQLQIDSYEMSEFTVRVYGETAVVTFRVVWNGSYGSVDISGPQRMTDVFVLRDGEWRCVSSHASRITPPRESPNA